MIGMAQFPDKYFDLAIVDPPYGIGEDGKSNHSRSCLAQTTKFKPKKWDKEPPPPGYFDLLKQKSKNQIIWGANHFIDNFPFMCNSPCWLVWDKENGKNDFADCELAWTSYSTTVRKFRFQWQGMLQGNMKNKEIRIHPTQKPVQLYKWTLHNYAKPDFKIIDTHVGSASSIIAFLDYSCEWIGFEIDKRIEIHKQQLKLFK